MQRKIVEREIENMLQNDIIEPSDSPYASPVCLVKKKDDSVRFSIDYCRLNSQTKKDAFPLPRIDESLESLTGARWFSTLDMASGYWQCKMAEKDKIKTAFTTHKGLYQFKVLPFGLCNAPATFQRLVNLVLGKFQWQKCLCYLDDIIVFGDTFELALENLQAVFNSLRKANLKLKPKKCVLFQNHVKFLGHVVSDQGISCDEDKIQTVLDWPIPSNVSEVRGFLGFSWILSPLYT
mgnify:CR=1 FL=1